MSMVVTDLDGTLLNDKQKTSTEDLDTLRKLKTKGITTVIATGRSVYSINKVIPKDFPIDYIVFSSGAGILDFKKKRLIYSFHLTENEIKQGTKAFLETETDFSIQNPIPDNHKYCYYKTGKRNPDFDRRCELYKEFTTKIDIDKLPAKACQLIGIIPEGIEKFEKIKSKIKELKTIRTTSPLDGKTIWIELFPKNVSKASGIEILRKKLNKSKNNIIIIGNDYNDIDMLDYGTNSFVVNSAPNQLKSNYKTTKGSNNESAFSELCLKMLSIC